MCASQNISRVPYYDRERIRHGATVDKGVVKKEFRLPYSYVQYLIVWYLIFIILYLGLCLKAEQER